MHFRLLIAATFLSLSVSAAHARKPAVEDFVGIEISHLEPANPQGADTLFNLEKDLIKHEEATRSGPVKLQAPPSEAWSLVTIMGMIVGLGLPMLTLFLVMNHMRKKASIESAANIEILERYRKERELKKKEEAFRKSA